MSAMEQKAAFLGREPVAEAEDFMGRRAEIRWLADKLGREMPQNCNIVGEPRIGKSSLLQYVYRNQIGLPKGMNGVYVWLRLVELSDYSPDSFWHFVVKRVVHALKRHGLDVNDDVLNEPNLDARDLFDALDEMLEQIIESGELARIILLIDDFDVLVYQGIQSRDLDWLRSLVTRYGEVLAFVISSTDSLVRLSERILQHEDESGRQMVSPFANIFHNLQMGLMSRADAEALCREAAVAEGVSALSEADIDFLLLEAGRHPAMLKIGVGYLFEAQRLSEPNEIYEDARSDFLFDGHVRWLSQNLFTRRTMEEKQALLELANDTAVTCDPIIINRLKRQLGLVEKRNGRLSLFSNAFQHWTQRQKIEEPETEFDKETVDAAASEPTFEYVAPSRTVRFSNGEEVRLTPLENRLLSYFLENANKVCTTDELLKNIWGSNKTRAVVEKAVNRLRTKIEVDQKRPRFILSARGEGYLLRIR